jgi:hypothetical protein
MENLRTIVRAMVQSEIAAAIRDMINVDPIAPAETDKAGRAIDDPNFGVPAKQSKNGRTFADVRADASQPEPENGASSGRRRRGRGRAKVAYQLVPRRKGERWPELVGNPAEVLGALRATGEPMTNAQIEKVIDMGNKSVQSAIHLLRTMRLVKSVPVSTR